MEQQSLFDNSPPNCHPDASFIEAMFANALARRDVGPFVREYPIGPYRADFACIAKRLVVELDGHDHHHTKEQRAHDAKRTRYLKSAGWDEIRFTGPEVVRDVDRCVTETDLILKARPDAQPLAKAA